MPTTSSPLPRLISFNYNSCVYKLLSIRNLQMQLSAWRRSVESVTVGSQKLRRCELQTFVQADQFPALSAQQGRCADGRIVFAPHRRSWRDAADVSRHGGALGEGRSAPRRSRRDDLDRDLDPVTPDRRHEAQR